MGGSGSGRWGSSKPFSEALARFDLADSSAEVNAAARAGRVLEMKWPTGNGFEVTAQIRFTTTAVHLGGCRVWMICPRCCGSARATFAGRGKIGCRRCLRLRYRSQCGDAKDRAHLAIAKIEKRPRQGAQAEATASFQQGRGIILRLMQQSPDNARLPEDLVWLDNELATLKN
jgi:hypothetical protein